MVDTVRLTVAVRNIGSWLPVALGARGRWPRGLRAGKSVTSPCRRLEAVHIVARTVAAGLQHAGVAAERQRGRRYSPWCVLCSGPARHGAANASVHACSGRRGGLPAELLHRQRGRRRPSIAAVRTPLPPLARSFCVHTDWHARTQRRNACGLRPVRLVECVGAPCQRVLTSARLQITSLRQARPRWDTGRQVRCRAHCSFVAALCHGQWYADFFISTSSNGVYYLNPNVALTRPSINSWCAAAARIVTRSVAHALPAARARRCGDVNLARQCTAAPRVRIGTVAPGLNRITIVNYGTAAVNVASWSLRAKVPRWTR
jgi:hypothetical protein